MPPAGGSAVWMDLSLLLAVSVAAASVVVLTVALAALGRRLSGWYSTHRHTLSRERDLKRGPMMGALLGSGFGVALTAIGVARYLLSTTRASTERIGLYAAVLFGALIFSLCAIALCKLRGALQIEAVARPGHHVVNLVALLLCAWLGYSFVTEQAQPGGLAALLASASLAVAMGAHLMLSREYAGDAAHAANRDSCSLRLHAVAARTDGFAIGKPGLLANLEWQGGEEQMWALREVEPVMMRVSAYANRRGLRDGRRGNIRQRDCARKCAHERPVHLTGRR
jgi:NAD(P) transhydrogenase subunit beta